MIKNRPLSPHLSIYKPQITSVLSILHRITGVILVLGSACFSLLLLSVVAGPDAYKHVVSFINSLMGKFLLISFLFSFFYHFFNGVRHLLWDVGCGLSIKQAYFSGYAVILMTLLCTGVTWFCV